MTLLVISTLLTSYLSFVSGQSQCTTPNGKSGNCISIFNCSSLARLASSSSQNDIDFLRSSFCGFEGNTPRVCCPRDGCTTPDGVLGSCIGLYSCQHLVNMLQPPQSQAAIQYVQRSRCEGTEKYSVCCGPSTTARPTPATPATPTTSAPTRPPTPPTTMVAGKCQLTAFPPDPSTECCGRDASGGGNRIVGGTATAIDEYPWLALVEYVKDNRHKLLCGGVLISGRYVLTAGHCIVGPVLNVGTPVNVRLGEYDTSNPGADCPEVEGGGVDCNDGAVTVPIEKTIPHPEYNPSSRLRRHDIALLRLDRIVQYTDFIRPICLPSVDFTLQPPANTKLMAAGWGAVDEFKSSSNIKLKVALPFLSYQECQPSYSVPSRRVELWDGQICAGGELGKDSCKGDSGGPLMRENGTMYELVGIVSFGPTPCGMDNVAGVYSKVFHYLPWIRSQIVE